MLCVMHIYNEKNVSDPVLKNLKDKSNKKGGGRNQEMQQKEVCGDYHRNSGSVVFPLSSYLYTR